MPISVEATAQQSMGCCRLIRLVMAADQASGATQNRGLQAVQRPLDMQDDNKAHHIVSASHTTLLNLRLDQVWCHTCQQACAGSRRCGLCTSAEQV